MVDPLLRGFDIPVLFYAPIASKDVPHLDAVLITHGDNDRYRKTFNEVIAQLVVIGFRNSHGKCIRYFFEKKFFRNSRHYGACCTRKLPAEAELHIAVPLQRQRLTAADALV